MLIDCGHNEETGFRPSSYLPANGCTGIERLVVSNYDEDHLSDLPDLRRRLPIQILHRNRSIDADELRRLKISGGPLKPGLISLLDMIGTYTADVVDPPEFPGIEMAVFSNTYPSFRDTNNLSLITFLHYRDIHIIFPGDLERPGWRALLQQPTFREHLSQVNLFVASHHGREGGYCADVFNLCNPELIVISDESIQFETQLVEYAQHAKGIRWGDGRRYVLTTRNDGMITISRDAGQSAQVSTAR